MKGILVVIDGMADLPINQFAEKTPLEAANKPNLDYLASLGELGYVYTINENFVPESDGAILSLLGNNPQLSTRGELEAIGAGIELQRGDLALRINFATIDNLESENIIDRRAGRTLTTKEAVILAKAINSNVKLPCKFIFKPTVQHRGVLVLKGGFSDNITNTDPAYRVKGKFELRDKLKFSEPLDEDDNTKYTANLVNGFIEQSYKILDNHPINQNRRKRGLMPANIILTRDAGTESPIVSKLTNWCNVAYMPLEIGIAKVLGMGIFSFRYPNLRNYDVYRNLYDGLNAAINFSIKVLKSQHKKYDYAYIHLKETDVPGHDNKPYEKKAMIELIDKRFFSFIRNFCEKNKIRLAVTADHATPCRLRSHSSDPVPLLVFGNFANTAHKQQSQQKFSERDAAKGSLGKIYGKNLLKTIGFAK